MATYCFTFKEFPSNGPAKFWTDTVLNVPQVKKVAVMVFSTYGSAYTRESSSSNMDSLKAALVAP